MKTPHIQTTTRALYSYEHPVAVDWETGELTIKLSPAALRYAASNVTKRPSGCLYIEARELERVLDEQLNPRR